MDTFELLFHPAAAKDLEKLVARNGRLLARAEKALRGLRSNPYGGQKKSGPISDCYALGFTFEKVAYRIVYRVRPPRVLVMAVGVHDVAYRRARRR